MYCILMYFADHSRYRSPQGCEFHGWQNVRRSHFRGQRGRRNSATFQRKIAAGTCEDDSSQ